MRRTLTKTLSLTCVLLASASGPMAFAATSTPRTGDLPLVQTAGAAKIVVPDTVDPGATVAVDVTGSAPGGRIELWGPVTQSGNGTLIGSTTTTGGAITLTAPSVPGSYELRYYNPGGALATRTPLDVAGVPITLSAPRSLGAGIDSQVEWRGPADPGDMIQVYDPATGAILSEAPAIGQPGVVNVTVLRGPERMGDFAIRYWSNSRQASLRELPIVIDGRDAFLRTPIEVFAGERFTAEWVGPNGAGYAYQVVDPANEVVIDSAEAGAGPVQLKAPSRPGAYRVRFVNTTTGYVVTDLPLDVDPR